MGALNRLIAAVPASLRRHAIVIKGPRGLAVDRQFIRWTGLSLITVQYGIAGNRPYCPTLLLTTIGRRSGQRRTVALPWVSDGDDLLVVGSAAGGPHDPAWVHNLIANPQCVIRRRGRAAAAMAHVARGHERERVFARLVEVRQIVAEYDRMATEHGRELPLVVIRPLPRR